LRVRTISVRARNAGGNAESMLLASVSQTGWKGSHSPFLTGEKASRLTSRA
jgi:hypothetical protein